MRSKRPPAFASREAIELAFLIHDVARLHRRSFAGMVAPLCMPPSQWTVMAQLSRRDGARAATLAAALGISPRRCAGAVRQLVGRGWVERRRDATDRRRHRVWLLPAARSALALMQAEGTRLDELALGRLCAADRALARRGLETMRLALGALPQRSG